MKVFVVVQNKSGISNKKYTSIKFIEIFGNDMRMGMNNCVPLYFYMILQLGNTYFSVDLDYYVDLNELTHCFANSNNYL